MSIYTIFKNGEMKGYLQDENSARQSISDLADSLIEELKSPNVRVFRENVSSGIKIYTQATGTYINGSVNLQHTLCWNSVPIYTFPEKRNI